jgi:metal-dependent amidase/aminoacylase/carboxypeptidase family protein
MTQSSEASSDQVLVECSSLPPPLRNDRLHGFLHDLANLSGHGESALALHRIGFDEQYIALQTIVSREVKPGEMAVVTVGYIQAGTKNNIISDHAEMGLTVRTFKQNVRQQILAAITRIAKAEAAAAGAPKEPLVERYEGTDLVYNNPALAERLRAPLEAALGKDKVVIAEPITPSEDFSYFIEQGVPGFYFSLGRADPEKFAQAKAAFD